MKTSEKFLMGLIAVYVVVLYGTTLMGCGRIFFKEFIP